jgi:hypothetical protein
MMLFIWWCWHICKREVRVDLDELGKVEEEKEKKKTSLGCPRVKKMQPNLYLTRNPS